MMENDPTERWQCMYAIAEAWRHANVQFRVVHGMDRKSQTIGRDVDVLIRRQEVKKASRKIVETASQWGFTKVIQRRSPWGIQQVVAVNPISHENLAVDLMHGARVWTNYFAYNVEPDSFWRLSSEADGPIVHSPALTFLKAIVRPILVGDNTRFLSTHRQDWPDSLGAAESELLVSMFGEREADRFSKLMSRGPSSFEGEGRKFRKTMIHRHLTRHPFRSLRGGSARIYVAAALRLFPFDLLVLCPPGNATIRAVSSRLQEHFFVVRTSRPREIMQLLRPVESTSEFRAQILEFPWVGRPVCICMPMLSACPSIGASVRGL
jgi:hypothetical protein